jgi:PAS domain S-box-containing protein
MQFAAAQSDFMQFMSLFAVGLCCLESVILHREESSERRWLAISGFFLLQGLALLWALFQPLIHAAGSPYVVSALRAVSYCSLFALFTRASASDGSTARALLFSLVPLAICALIGAFFGNEAFRAAFALLLLVPGITLAVRFVMSDPEIRGRPRLVAFGIALVLFGLAVMVFSLADLRAPGRWSDAAVLVRMVLFVILALSLSLHEWNSFNRLNRGFGARLTRYAILAGLFSLPVVIGLGAFATNSLGNRMTSQLFGRYSSDAAVIQREVTIHTGEVDRDVGLLTPIDLFPALILHPESGTKSFVTDVLNRFAREVHGTVYVLDREGRVVAASSNGSPAFMGSSHANAAWFKDALTSGGGRTFDVGGSIIAPAYFSSAPLWDLETGIVGVVMIQKDLAELFPPSNPEADVFLVDENGVIIYATMPSTEGRLLWPFRVMAGGVPGALVDTGLSHDAPLLDARLPSGSAVPWKGTRFMVARAFLPIPGWAIEELGPLDEVLQYRLAGLLVTLTIAFVIAAVTAAGRLILIDEARVERSETLYRMLVEGSPNWVSIVDDSGIFSFTNRAGRMGLRIAADAARDVSVESVIGREGVAEVVRRVQDAATRGTVSFEITLPTAMGDEKVWSATLIPRLDQGEKKAAILIANDITGARAAETRLVRAERLAALGTLAAGVAHQFNNINTIIQWNLQLLDSLKGLPPGAVEYITSMRSALGRSVEITSRLLPLAESGSGEQRPRLGRILRDMITVIHPDLDREGITLEESFLGDAAVSMDAGQLSFVVHALLVNAWHAVLDQPVRRIRVSIPIADSFAILIVEDTGIGIAPEKLGSIFTPFFSEKGEHAPPGSPLGRVHGVGLSLSVSHSMVTAGGGRIEVESTLGKGTTFTIWLPLAPAQG